MKRPARKRFGQNFLIDESVIRRIVDTIAPRPDEVLIEIGPGRGAITAPLLRHACALHVLEIDHDLVADLKQQYATSDYPVVHDGDALETDFSALVAGQPYRLLGNLPYNISTPLIFHILEQTLLPTDMHFMLQKEVVDRLAAGPGSKNYGRLGIMCQNLCQTTALFDIGPEAFSPAPRVTSAFVRLEPRPEPLSGQRLLIPLDRVVRAAFSKRRKTLRNCLSGLLTADQLAATGIDPGNRAEQLPLEDFIRLAGLLDQPQSP